MNPVLLGWNWGVGTHGVQSIEINMEINFMHVCIHMCDRIYTCIQQTHMCRYPPLTRVRVLWRNGRIVWQGEHKGVTRVFCAKKRDSTG